MAIESFIHPKNKSIAFCVIDDTYTYKTDYTCALVKNIADYTITNIHSKEYDVYQGMSEDAVLKHVTNLGYKFALVYSPGTEFINGDSFFNAVEELIKKQFFIAGHVLDRGNAYYELHHQCYIINLESYKKLGCPAVGQQTLGSTHIQTIPARSKENYHDNYTPIWVGTGSYVKEEYDHKCHGWNILSTAFEHNETVIVFDEIIKESKKHYYPENQTEFLKHIQWAYKRQNYCFTEFVHKSSTDTIDIPIQDIEQVLTPASGLEWTKFISKDRPVNVVMYDYNQNALDFWESSVPKIPNVTYQFMKIDLLVDSFFFPSVMYNDRSTLINLSNVFAYEATCPFYSTEYRISRENELGTNLKNFLPDAFIYWSVRACSGFSNQPTQLYARDYKEISLSELSIPTWHLRDWID